MVWASISPEADYDRTVAAIQEVTEGYPGLDRRLITYSSQRVNDIATSDAAPVTVRVYGEDLTVLQQKADEIRAAIAGVDGVESERVSTPSAEPTIQVEVDLAKALVHGVKPGDVRRAATTLLAGIQVGSIFDNNKVFDVVVWSPPDVRKNLTDVRNLLIDTPSGGHVRLGQVADVKIVGTPNTISHDAVSRRVDVTAQVSGRDLGAVLADVRDQAGRRLLPARVPRGSPPGRRRAAGRPARPHAHQRVRGPRPLPAAAVRVRQLAAGAGRSARRPAVPGRGPARGAAGRGRADAVDRPGSRGRGSLRRPSHDRAVPATSSDYAGRGRAHRRRARLPGSPRSRPPGAHHEPHHGPGPAPAPRSRSPGAGWRSCAHWRA